MSYLDTVQSIKRAVLYLRVSTDMQAEKFSLPAQEKLTKELATKHGWEIVKTYRDEGFSGSWIEKRPQFSMLLKDAALKKFPSRFPSSRWRNPAAQWRSVPQLRLRRYRRE